MRQVTAAPAPSAMRRLWRDRSGLALLEFAYAMPLVLGMGLWGVELSNYALAQMQVSQIALELADNASRVGLSSGLAEQQLREDDITDVLAAVRRQGRGIDLLGRGRVTLSSLEAVDGVQRIHWQRCIGMKRGAGYDSSYGTTQPSAGSQAMPNTPGTVVSGGMGPAGGRVVSPDDSGVMFVEINYDYKPVIDSRLVGARRISYLASFIVRDRRNFSRIYDTSATKRSSCDKYTA